jgi:hypothetical protein
MGSLKTNRAAQLLDKYHPYLLSALFFAIAAALALMHEPNSEEIHAWNIVSTYDSFPGFISFMRFEDPAAAVSQGHPLLWYVLLYFINHYISGSIMAMILTHVIISALTVFLILKYSPFNLYIRFLWIFGYYQFYNYSLIIRNYSIGILFLILFCVFYRVRTKNLILCSVILFIMSQANLFSFILAAILFFMMIFDIIMQRRSLSRKDAIYAGSVSSVFFLGSVAFIYWVLYYQIFNNTFGENINTIFAKTPGEYYSSLLVGLRGIVRAFLPINQFSIKFWENNIITGFLEAHGAFLLIPASILLLISSAFILGKRYIYFYIFSVSAMLLVSVLIYPKLFDRHHGHFLYIFLALLWLSRKGRCREPLLFFSPGARQVFASAFLTAVMLLSFINSAACSWHEYRYVFSHEKLVPVYAAGKGEDVLVISDKFDIADAVGGYLDRYSYNTVLGEYIKIPPWSRPAPVIDDRYIFRDSMGLIKEGVKAVLATSKSGLSDYKDIEVYQEDDCYMVFKRTYFLDNKEVISNDLDLHIYEPLVSYELAESIRFDAEDIPGNWEAVNDCSMSIKENGVLIDVLGKDPQIESRFEIQWMDDNPLLLVIDIDCEEGSVLKIYLDSGGSGYSEAGSRSFVLQEGKNQVSFILENDPGLSTIRIDPVNLETDCIIYGLNIFNITGSRKYG